MTVGILAWVFHKYGGQIFDVLTHEHPNPWWLLAGFGCYGVVELLAAFRWFILLRVQDVHLPPWRVGALLMLGIFFNMFMPGGTGRGLKIYFLLKKMPKKKAEGLLAVLMDRLIGLLALIMISSVIIAIQYDWLKTNPVTRSLTWVLLLILAASLRGSSFRS